MHVCLDGLMYPFGVTGWKHPHCYLFFVLAKYWTSTGRKYCRGKHFISGCCIMGVLRLWEKYIEVAKSEASLTVCVSLSLTAILHYVPLRSNYV